MTAAPLAALRQANKKQGADALSGPGGHGELWHLQEPSSGAPGHTAVPETPLTIALNI